MPADPDVNSSIASLLRHSCDVYHLSEPPADDARNPESVASPSGQTNLWVERPNETEAAIPVNGMVNFFGRNVAKHVQEHQLIQRFSKESHTHHINHPFLFVHACSKQTSYMCIRVGNNMTSTEWLNLPSWLS